MRKLKKWLYNKFLPAWCKEDLMEANAHLTGVIVELKRENEKLRAYIRGMETALRRCGRITINTGEVRQ